MMIRCPRRFPGPSPPWDAPRTARAGGRTRHEPQMGGVTQDAAAKAAPGHHILHSKKDGSHTPDPKGSVDLFEECSAEGLLKTCGLDFESVLDGFGAVWGGFRTGVFFLKLFEGLQRK